jgi:hypothetical protein
VREPWNATKNSWPDLRLERSNVRVRELGNALHQAHLADVALVAVVSMLPIAVAQVAE